MSKNTESTERTEDQIIAEWCDQFINSDRPKYLLGRNEFAEKIVRQINITGFIDDFSDEPFFLEKPVIRAENAPSNALVLVMSSVRTLTAMNRAEEQGLDALDYISFHEHSGLKLDKIWIDGFNADFSKNKHKYDQVLQLLSDGTSKIQFKKLVEYKQTLSLKCLAGFKCLLEQQYFEDFLDLKPSGEVFADIGAYDGFTSETFSKICPDYDSIHIFEPIPENMIAVKKRLRNNARVHYHEYGLSNQQLRLKFKIGGSASCISDEGNLVVEVKRLDDVLSDKITFLKMDIEGGETAALEGAEHLISTYHPRLAISVYHNPSDIWRIPELVLSIFPDYKVYLRHYTESIYETVMFFIPK